MLFEETMTELAIPSDNTKYAGNDWIFLTVRENPCERRRQNAAAGPTPGEPPGVFFMRHSHGVQHAVLGVVSRNPEGIHGYAVRRQGERLLGHFWQLNFGEVYRIL